MYDFRDVEDFKAKSGYDIDGVWYPRVTKILEIKSKPALYRYYGEAASYQAAQAITQKSAEEGTLIHETIQKRLTGEMVPIDASIAPAVNAALQFVEDKNIQFDPAFIEKRLVNYDQRYAGTIDALALIGGKMGVLDIKTSQAIYRDYNLQTSAYMEPLSGFVKNLQTRWIFRIDQQKTCQRCGAMLRQKGGRDKIRLPYPRRGTPCPTDQHDWGPLAGLIELKEFPYWQDDYQAFLGAKKLWEWENEHWLKEAKYI